MTATPAATSADDVITLDHVHKAFGDFVAVRDADFSIRRGEFFSMLGPSGCGKTTTLRMIAGFEEPTQGRVLLDGKDVSRTPPYKRNVNTVFQQYALFPHMSVFDNVAFGPRNKKADEKRLRDQVMDILGIVRMDELAKRKPAQLSGGQQQRVALARALVNLPSALLLDEPLGALDLKLRQAMQLELKRIQREVGITFIFVTHDQEEALTMSDRIAVMSQGDVEQIGSPEDIYHRPATVFVAGFIGTANLCPGTICEVGEGRVGIALADGTKVRASDNGHAFALSSPGTLVLRPERLHLTTVEPDAGTAIGVQVTDLTFQGSRVRVGLVTSDGTPLVAEVGPGDPQLAALAPGERLWITWDAAGAYVLPETTAQAGATGVDIDQVEASL